MSGKKVHNSIHKYGKRLSTLGAQITPQFDINNIHDFRTTVKKLHALLQWLSPVKKPLTKSFKKIYHISGELRNAQVLLEDMDAEKEKLAGFRKWLTASLTQLKKQWYKTYDPKVIMHLREKIEQQDYKKAKQKKIKSFFQKKIDRIKGILYLPSPPDEELHEARKMLKDMQYVYEWSEKKRIIGDYQQNLKALKRIGKQAGNFNDKRIAVMLLTTYLEEESGTSLDQAVMEVKQKWEESKERQKKELVETLTGFVRANRPHSAN